MSSLATPEVAKSRMDEKIQVEDSGLQLTLSNNISEQKNMEFSRTFNAVDYKAHNHKKIDMIKTTEERRNQTLELFPYWIGEGDDQYQMSNGQKVDDSSEMGTATLNSKFTPTHFFEFIPLKH